MDVHIDLRVLELLSSRLCHDLVGPVGAVNNGLELLEDDMGDMGPEALKLVADSGARAARALQYFRLAFGMAGSRVGGSLDELRDLAGGFFDGNKIALTWPAQGIPDDAPSDLGKLLLNMLLLGAESLPMGGSLTIGISASGGGLGVEVTASGERAGLRDETRPALAAQAEIGELTPRNVQAYFTCRIAERMDGAITVDEGTDGAVKFTASLAS